MKLDDEDNELSNAENNEFRSKYNINDWFLSDCNNDGYFVTPLEGDEKAPAMPQLEVDEEKLKEEKGLKTLTPNN